MSDLFDRESKNIKRPRPKNAPAKEIFRLIFWSGWELSVDKKVLERKNKKFELDLKKCTTSIKKLRRSLKIVILIKSTTDILEKCHLYLRKHHENKIEGLIMKKCPAIDKKGVWSLDFLKSVTSTKKQKYLFSSQHLLIFT